MSYGDPRTGPSVSGHVTITDANGNTPQTALTIPSDALFKMTGYKVNYADAGTGTDIEVGFFDDAPGTAAGSVSDQRDSVRGVFGGEERKSEYIDTRDFEEGVLVQSIGDNHDQDIEVTVYGKLLTHLADMK